MEIIGPVFDFIDKLSVPMWLWPVGLLSSDTLFWIDKYPSLRSDTNKYLLLQRILLCRQMK